MTAPNLTTTTNGEVELTPEAIEWLGQHGWCYVDGTSTDLSYPRGNALRRALCERALKPRLKLRLSGEVEQV